MKKKPTKMVKAWGWFNRYGELIGCSPSCFNQNMAKKDIEDQFHGIGNVTTGRVTITYTPAKPRKR